jgi:hypothetical protein
MAGLGRSVGLAAGPLSGLSLQVAPQFYPPGRHASFTRLGVYQPIGSPGFPWDSTWTLSDDGYPRSGLSPGAAPQINLILWDSTRQDFPKHYKKSKSPIPDFQRSRSGNQALACVSNPLWDHCENLSTMMKGKMRILHYYQLSNPIGSFPSVLRGRAFSPTKASPSSRARSN